MSGAFSGRSPIPRNHERPVMRFNILGALEVFADSGQMIQVNRKRVRSLLTVLLLNSGRPVTTDYLLEAVWGADARVPESGTLRSHLYLLRTCLAPADRLRRCDGGYQLSVAPSELDLAAFRLLVGKGRSALDHGDYRRAEEQLGQAIALWRDSELHDLPATPALSGQAQSLSAEYAAARESLIDAMLGAGQHREAVPLLIAQTAAHPGNERIWGQLIVSLYRSGRRAEAIQAYIDVRNLLTGEFGIDPGPALCALFDQVLHDDPALLPESDVARIA
jgi:DNA-binding SARP family transcriptional activator